MLDWIKDKKGFILYADQKELFEQLPDAIELQKWKESGVFSLRIEEQNRICP